MHVATEYVMVKTGFYAVTTGNLGVRKAAKVCEEEEFWERVAAHRRERQGIQLSVHS